MKRCEHRRVDNWDVLLTITYLERETRTRTCRDCGVQLPLGAATITLDVLVEERAAEIAASTTPIQVMSYDERDGWRCAGCDTYRVLLEDQEHVILARRQGWLAYQITHHEELINE